jgi:photosystem II stability/assembly factor-like uncharacterized protein
MQSVLKMTMTLLLAWMALPAVAATEVTDGQTIQWRLAGPGGGGWIQSIAWDPQEKDFLYVGGDVGGFFFSADAGRTFEIRNQGLRDYFLEAIAVHPRDSRIILAGTESGIHRTVDRGLSWQWIRSGFPATDRYRFTAPIGALCFDPRRPGIAYAGIGRPRPDQGGAGAIYRSDDTGVTWRKLETPALPASAIVSALAVKPDDSRSILAATSAGVFRSDDDGRTWQLSSEGLPHLYTEELAFAPSAPGTVYATLRCRAKPGQPWDGGVFRSDDAGRTWRAVNGDGLPKSVGDGSDPRYLSSNPKDLAIDPRSADTVYAGFRDWVSAGIYKTADGGRTWRKMTRRQGADANMEYGWITEWGSMAECLALSPLAPERLAFGSSGHVFLSEDGGGSWRQRYAAPAPAGTIAGNGLAVTCAWCVATDPVRPDRLYFCYMDIGLMISDDGGKTFRRAQEGMAMGGNSFGVMVDPQVPETLWAATGMWHRNEGTLYRSDDDGRSWRQAATPHTGLPKGQVLEMALDPKSPVGKRRLLAAVNGQGIFETLDGGTSWHCLNGDLPARTAAAAPAGLLLDPADSRHLVAALGRQLHETRDGGQTWRRLDMGDGFGEIKQLVADPHNFSKLYLAVREFYDAKAQRLFPGGAFRSADGGHAWQPILNDRFAQGIAISPADPGLIYVATNDHPYHDAPVAAGLFRSTDGGQTWTRENRGLTNQNLKGIVLSPHDPGLLYLSTGGNSVFIGRDNAVKPAASRSASGR